jgi:hypothetical protein
MIIYTKPVSAVITIDDDARTIDVEGCQGEFVGGVTIEMSGNSSGYRPCTPDMISTHIAY